MTNKALIYDDNCPLCDAYTKVFVKTKLLKRRIAFSEVHPQDLKRVDAERSKHEIPLLDLDGGATLYGLDSLVMVLGEKFPLIKKGMRVDVLYGFFHRLYQLISYNRRLIVGKNSCDNGFDCTPDFHFRFRSLYIFISTIIAASIYFIFGQISTPVFGFSLLAFLGLALVWSYFFTPTIRKRLSYLGQFCTIFMIGALVLVPSLLFYLMLPSTPFFVFALNLVGSFFLMSKEWQRRKSYWELKG